MGSPDTLTRINQFLLLLPPTHHYDEIKEKKDGAESKDEFSLLLEKFLDAKDQSPDGIKILETGKQIWQMVEEKKGDLGKEEAIAAIRPESGTSLKTEGIIKGKDENQKREYFSSLILSCFVEPGQRTNYPFEGYQDGGERLFFYSSQYSSQTKGQGTSSLKILKEAIASLNKKGSGEGILEGFKDPDPGSESGTRLAETGFGEDELSLSGVSFEELKAQASGQDILKDQSETGEDGRKEIPVFPFFDSRDSDLGGKSADQGAGHSLENNESFLSSIRAEDKFEEEESSLDDSKESPDETFMFNKGSQAEDTEYFVNFGRSGQTRPTPKFISQETKGEISKIIERMKLLKEGEQTEVRMELDLERLGKLRIKIAKEDSELSTEFLAESSEAKELIESNIEALRAALASLGFDQVNIKTTVNHRGNNDFFEQKRGRSSPGRRSYGSKEEIEDDQPLISLRGESLNLVA